MKILLCFGTRPEAIKMAPVIYELDRQEIEYEICVSAQHREMLDHVLEFFEITPDYDLDLMRPNQSLNYLSGTLLLAFDQILEKSKPDLVIVHGDTTTSSIVSMASFHRKIPVAHVEAGLRTFNPDAPFPEEINRQLTARIATFHFAPTEGAKQNLVSENIATDKIFITGNTIVDALQIGKHKLKNLDSHSLKTQVGLQGVDLQNYILITGHRRENVGQGFKIVCEAIIDLVQSFPELSVVFPTHLNPNVRESVIKKLENIERVFLIEPVCYPGMLWLMSNCNFIISDSGGVQEEAPTFKKKVLVTREVSERMEGVEAGFASIVGINKEKILAEAHSIINDPVSFLHINNPYGDGNAAKRIVDILKVKLFNLKDELLKKD